MVCCVVWVGALSVLGLLCLPQFCQLKPFSGWRCAERSSCVFGFALWAHAQMIRWSLKYSNVNIQTETSSAVSLQGWCTPSSKSLCVPVWLSTGLHAVFGAAGKAHKSRWNCRALLAGSIYTDWCRELDMNKHQHLLGGKRVWRRLDRCFITSNPCIFSGRAKRICLDE